MARFILILVATAAAHLGVTGAWFRCALWLNAQQLEPLWARSAEWAAARGYHLLTLPAIAIEQGCGVALDGPGDTAHLVSAAAYALVTAAGFALARRRVQRTASAAA